MLLFDSKFMTGFGSRREKERENKRQNFAVYFLSLLQSIKEDVKWPFSIPGRKNRRPVRPDKHRVPTAVCRGRLQFGRPGVHLRV